MKLLRKAIVSIEAKIEASDYYEVDLIKIKNRVEAVCDELDEREIARLLKELDA